MLKANPLLPEYVPTHRLLYRLVLLCVYLCIFAALAVAPFNRADWLLENALTLLLMIIHLATWCGFCFSLMSDTLLFLFMTLHAIGAHYTYSNVPFDSWWTGMIRRSLNEALNLSRNHYDRPVRLCYGLLLVIPFEKSYSGALVWKSRKVMLPRGPPF